MKKFFFFLSFMACTFIFAQKKITKKYRYGENAENAKVLFKKFHDGILAQKYEIEYQDDLSSNDIAVHYTFSDKAGTANIVATYKFNTSDFTIQLFNIIYTVKSTGVRFVIMPDSSDPSSREYFESIRNLFVTMQSNYISPDLK